MEIKSLGGWASSVYLRLAPSAGEQGGFYTGYGAAESVGRVALLVGIPVEDANRIYNFANNLGEEKENLLPQYLETDPEAPGVYLLKNGASATIIGDDPADRWSASCGDRIREFGPPASLDRGIVT